MKWQKPKNKVYPSRFKVHATVCQSDDWGYSHVVEILLKDVQNDQETVRFYRLNKVNLPTSKKGYPVAGYLPFRKLCRCRSFANKNLWTN